MAAHEKFVLKERQRLQAKEKELEKKEADAAAIKDRLAAVEVELKSKSAQLTQTAELLRKSREERDAARREGLGVGRLGPPPARALPDARRPRRDRPLLQRGALAARGRRCA